MNLDLPSYWGSVGSIHESLMIYTRGATRKRQSSRSNCLAKIKSKIALWVSASTSRSVDGGSGKGLFRRGCKLRDSWAAKCKDHMPRWPVTTSSLCDAYRKLAIREEYRCGRRPLTNRRLPRRECIRPLHRLGTFQIGVAQWQRGDRLWVPDLPES